MLLEELGCVEENIYFRQEFLGTQELHNVQTVAALNPAGDSEFEAVAETVSCAIAIKRKMRTVALFVAGVDLAHVLLVHLLKESDCANIAT